MNAAVLKANNILFHEKCPFCGSSEISLIGPLEYAMPCYYSTAQIELVKNSEIWQCRCCKSGFTQNFVSESQSKKIYQESDSSARWISVPFDIKHASTTIILMRKYLQKARTVLDIGCNTGELLDYARDLNCLTYGLEYSEASRQVLKIKGHHTYSSLSEYTRKV